MVKVDQFTSNSITLNVGAPQVCVLSPLLYFLYTHDCVSSHSSTSIIKFADDTVVLGLISNNDETAYLDEVERLTSWMNEWYIYIELYCVWLYTQSLSSTPTSVQHPLGWYNGCHRTTAPVRSPHRWRGERVIEPIKWMGIIRRP